MSMLWNMYFEKVADALKKYQTLDDFWTKFFEENKKEMNEPKRKKCEMCLAFGLEESEVSQSVTEIWLHQPFNSAPCRYVSVCQECLDNGCHTEIDPYCKQCQS